MKDAMNRSDEVRSIAREVRATEEELERQVASLRKPTKKATAQDQCVWKAKRAAFKHVCIQYNR